MITSEKIRRKGRKPSSDGDESRPDVLEGQEKGARLGKAAERQLRSLLRTMEAVRQGDLTKTLTKEKEDLFGELAESYNGMVNLLQRFGGEVIGIQQGKCRSHHEVPRCRSGRIRSEALR
ncbi:MAG: hypothetical protein SVV80_07390 [Planctomycetota bacterium]|nr:hypothetical protein [Planctomycetota bacterium]